MMRFLFLVFFSVAKVFAATPINPNKKAAPAKSSKSSEGGFYPTFSLGLGFKTFSAIVGLGYEFNSWLSVEQKIFYRQVYNDPQYEKAYGSESDGIFRFANPSIATPYAGLGVGYAKWQRSLDNQEFDFAASPYWAYFLGVEGRLTSFLSIVGQTRWINYQRPPKDYFDTDAYESRNQFQFTVGFISHFSFDD